LVVVFPVGEFGVKHDPVTVEDDELEHNDPENEKSVGLGMGCQASAFEEDLL
jgi:hypothetical protein